MNTVTASAPGKLLLFGDHAVVYGHPCIVTAVDQRMTAEVSKRTDSLFVLEAPDVGIDHLSIEMGAVGGAEMPKGARFVERLYRRFMEMYPHSQGVTIRTRSQFSDKFGFGSSSAVTVAVGYALGKLYGVELTKQQLFSLCYKAVIDVQGVGSGFDIAAAIWGGTLYYVSPALVVEPLAIDGPLPFAVCYSGVKADTPTLVRQVQEQRKREPEIVDQVFRDMHAIVATARDAFAEKNWVLIGQLMSQSQALLQRIHVSTPLLESLCDAALDAGASGCKLSGAGGGDCIVACVDPSQAAAVSTAFKDHGGYSMHVTLHAPGVRQEEV